MAPSIVTTALTRSSAALRSIRGLACGAGVVSACYLIAIFYQYVATFGSTLPFLAAALIAAAAGCEIGLRGPFGVRRSQFASFATAIALLGCWVISFPWLAELMVSSASWFAVQTMSQPAVTVLLATFVASALLALPSFLIARIPQCLPAYDESDAHSIGRWYLVGTTVGLMINALVLAPLVGVQIANWLAAAFSGVLVAALWYRNQSQTSATVSINGAARTDHSTLWDRCGRIVAIVALGAAFALASRMIRQLTPGVAYIVCAEWAAVLGGVLVGRFWKERKLKHSDQLQAQLLGVCVMSAAWLVLLMATFPWFVSLMLELNASVSQVILLQFARVLTVWLMIVPLGVAWGALVLGPASSNFSRGADAGDTAPHADRNNKSNQLTSFAPLPFVVGYLLCLGVAIPQLGVPLACLAVAFGLTIVGAALSIWGGGRVSAEQSWHGRVFPAAWLGRLGLATCVVVVAAAPVWRSQYDPARAARLLFSSAVSAAKAFGNSGEALQVLDEGRLVTACETSRSTYTLWKYRGAQLQIRDNGIPKTVVSAAPETFPQYSGELMPAVLPLILHERPHRMLLLGLQGGLQLVTALDFPVVEVVCVESDTRLREMVEDVVWPQAGQDPLGDDRLRWLNCSQTVALACRDEAYDVIVSSPDQAALPHAATCFTVEFYQRAARRLADEGIFCQRFRCIDFGPEPVAVVAGTMSQAFEHMAAIETAPGELVLLGTNGASGLVRDELVERCQAPQVRHALSQLGWDWVAPLSLSAVGGQKLAEFVSESGEVNTAANGCFGFTLPQEVMRWGMKQQEVYDRLGHRSDSLLAWSTMPDDPDVSKRLAEVAAQKELMADSPDEYWAYRAVVRKQVTERPRSIIRQVSGEAPRKTLHPEEKRRLEYFQLLGQALKQRRPGVEQIARVAALESPYDPLLSFFLHDEVAQLYGRLDGAAAASEFVHRLHSIYYADPADRSVRNVSAAIQLLIASPAAVPDAQSRWDHLNALLQVLKGRWETRAGSAPQAAHVALVDVDRSLEAVEKGFATMDDLNSEVDADDAYWPARRAYLEKTLMRPLRTYRGQLLPHHQKEVRRKDRQADRSEQN